MNWGLVLFISVLFSCYCRAEPEFIPDPPSKTKVEAYDHEQYVYQMASVTAQNLNKINAVAQLMSLLNLNSRDANDVQQMFAQVNYKALGLKFHPSKSSIIIQVDKHKIEVKIVNPVLGKYQINGYAVGLNRNASITDQVKYLTRVIKHTTPTMKEIGKWTFLIENVYADTQEINPNSQVDVNGDPNNKDFVKNHIGIMILAIDGGLRDAQCAKYKNLNREKGTLNTFLGSILTAKSNQGSQVGGGSRQNQMSNYATDVGMEYWCSKEKMPNAFELTCNSKSEISSFKYTIQKNGETQGSVVNIYTGKKSIDDEFKAIMKSEKMFSSDFVDALKKCCKSRACIGEVNSIRKIEAENPDNLQDIKWESGVK